MCFAHTPEQIDQLRDDAKKAINGYLHDHGGISVYQVGTIFLDKDGNAGVMTTWRAETPNGKEIVDQTGEHYRDLDDFRGTP
ncbi:MAG: hypothetical protein QOI68_1275 [Pseudonocardiales bacterium]|nr:hypothetical protein [Pseudonocardiales bacterium]